MVKASRILAVVATATIGTYCGAGFLGILEFHAAQALIIADCTVPVWTVLTFASFVRTCHQPSRTQIAAAVGVVVVFPW